MKTVDACLLNKTFWDEVLRTAIDVGWERHISRCEGECLFCFCSHSPGCSCGPIKLMGHGCTDEDHEYVPIKREHGNCFTPRADEPYLVGGWIQLPAGGYVVDDSSDFAAISAGDEVTVLHSKAPDFDLPTKYYLENR
jgi:hypothetical protein